MSKKFIICLILFTLCSFNTSYSNNNLNESLNLNNTNDENVKIEIKNVEIINSAINLDEIYEAYSIITMNIVNTGLDYMELSNINYYFYQNHKKLQTFIQSENGYLGFVGTLESGEEKEIKIGVVLEEKNTPLKLVFENLNDINKEKVIKKINI